MKYEVEVFREDGAWIADVVGLPGAHTYARNLKVLGPNIDEVIRLVEDLDDEAAVEQHWRYQNLDPETLSYAKLAERREELETLQVQLAVATQVAAHNLAIRGFSIRDIGGLLDLSTARVGQILKSSEPARG